MVSLVLAWSYPAVRLVILCLLFRIHNSLSLAPSGHSVNAGLTFKCLNRAGLGTEHRTDLLLTWWVKLPSAGRRSRYVLGGGAACGRGKCVCWVWRIQASPSVFPEKRNHNNIARLNTRLSSPEQCLVPGGRLTAPVLFLGGRGRFSGR